MLVQTGISSAQIHLHEVPIAFKLVTHTLAKIKHFNDQHCFCNGCLQCKRIRDLLRRRVHCASQLSSLYPENYIEEEASHCQLPVSSDTKHCLHAAAAATSTFITWEYTQ